MARIIMAEDDEIVAEIARDALIAAGHGIGVLDNGVDALRVIRARRPAGGTPASRSSTAFFTVWCEQPHNSAAAR